MQGKPASKAEQRAPGLLQHLFARLSTYETNYIFSPVVYCVLLIQVRGLMAAGLFVNISPGVTQCPA